MVCSLNYSNQVLVLLVIATISLLFVNIFNVYQFQSIRYVLILSYFVIPDSEKPRLTLLASINYLISFGYVSCVPLLLRLSSVPISIGRPLLNHGAYQILKMRSFILER
jgi:hypothetical protein